MGTSQSGDLTVWSGWDLRGGVDADEGRTAFGQWSGSVDEDRYELIAVAARGFRPPQFLACTRIGADAAPVDASPVGSDRRSGALLRQVWSLAYRPVPPVSTRVEPPFAIYLLGVDPPDGASDDDLRAFEDFYVGVHVKEVAERRAALRTVPHELVEVVRAPYKGAPAFLTAYELDERSAAARRHVGPPYRPGPDVWQRHSTPWRLWYRRLEERD